MFDLVFFQQALKSFSQSLDGINADNLDERMSKVLKFYKQAVERDRLEVEKVLSDAHKFVFQQRDVS